MKKNAVWVNQLCRQGYQIREIRQVLRIAMSMTERELTSEVRDNKNPALVRNVCWQMLHGDFLELINFAFPKEEL